MDDIQSQPIFLIIVGISGDLARRKLLPALRQIAAAGELPREFRVIGITRRQLNVASLTAGDAFLAAHLELYQMDLAEVAAYDGLKRHLAQLEQQLGGAAQRLYYLSVPPQVSGPIVQLLGESGLAAMPDSKLLLEKPFGTDLASAEDFIAHTQRHFTEDQIYRIDHYLAKEMAQNLLVFRGGNALFRRTWNHEFIERIELLASEEIGIEGRSAFYEQTGALRDLVQSHLLQLAALTLMEVPPAGDETQLRAARLAALQALQPPVDSTRDVRRGQYIGYRAEVANPASATETFVSLTLRSHDPRWQGVPITLTTGKGLARKTTEIRIHYRQSEADEANELVLRVQPREGIELDLWAKRPGYDHRLERVPLEFAYSRHFDSLPEAYERVLVDAMRSRRSLFASSEEVLASWRILAPVQRAWGMSDKDLILYPLGSEPAAVIGR
ncbi:MAG TPA: glucose-6-phosphate dehydrogenase [Candidatus Saccharimonadia bacterium]|nr:glucose-6-phosphate dehydrogenase [Candidatus Saccharimonadia bacterium]